MSEDQYEIIDDMCAFCLGEGLRVAGAAAATCHVCDGAGFIGRKISKKDLEKYEREVIQKGNEFVKALEEGRASIGGRIAEVPTRDK